jgi:hypothetical protein
VRIEPPAAFPFPAACRSRSPADSVGVAAGPADGRIDLLQERQVVQTDARPLNTGPPRFDAEIVCVIACHDRTISIGFRMRKSSKVFIVVWRKKICCSVETAGHATPHLATATHFRIENKEKSIVCDTTHTVWSAATTP